MPFEDHGSRSFTLISIEKNAPAASGVYGLADTRQRINIGGDGGHSSRDRQNRERRTGRSGW